MGRQKGSKTLYSPLVRPAVQIERKKAAIGEASNIILTLRVDGASFPPNKSVEHNLTFSLPQISFSLCELEYNNIFGGLRVVVYTVILLGTLLLLVKFRFMRNSRLLSSATVGTEKITKLSNSQSNWPIWTKL